MLKHNGLWNQPQASVSCDPTSRTWCGNVLRHVRMGVRCIWRGCEGGTYKLHGAVVDEEVLDLAAPVGSEFEVSGAERRLAKVAAPRIDIFELVKSPGADQDVQTVLAETSATQEKKETTNEIKLKCWLATKGTDFSVRHKKKQAGVWSIVMCN